MKYKASIANAMGEVFGSVRNFLNPELTLVINGYVGGGSSNTYITQ